MKGHRQLRKGRRSLANQIYHISSGTINRKPFFADFECGRAVVHSMQREHEAGHAETLAYVVMPDHFHWLLSLTGTRQLSVSVNTVKSYAARRINYLLNRHGQIWQRSFYDRAIRREEDLVSVARYIVANPLRAGIAESVRDYSLWDATWL
jgi:REP element-mobilizing transposase RayT